MDKGHKTSILVIEDNPGDIELLRLALEQAEVDCNLKIFQRGEAMQSNLALAIVPIAVFSSSSLPRERARMEALRVMHYIVKPAELDGLLAIGRLLKEILAQSGCSK